MRTSTPVTAVSVMRNELSRLWATIRQRVARFDRHVVETEPQRAAASLIVAVTVIFVPLFSAWQVTNTEIGRAHV